MSMTLFFQAAMLIATQQNPNSYCPRNNHVEPTETWVIDQESDFRRAPMHSMPCERSTPRWLALPGPRERSSGTAW
jgi:hypothetical protein